MAPLTIELLHLAAALMVTAVIFACGAWAYPVGRGTIEAVGAATLVAVAVMHVPDLRRAWRVGAGRSGAGERGAGGR